MILSNFARESFPCCDFGQAEEMAAGAGGAMAMSMRPGSPLIRNVATGVLTGVLIWLVTRKLTKWSEK